MMVTVLRPDLLPSGRGAERRDPRGALQIVRSRSRYCSLKRGYVRPSSGAADLHECGRRAQMLAQLGINPAQIAILNCVYLILTIVRRKWSAGSGPGGNLLSRPVVSRSLSTASYPRLRRD